MKNSLKHCFSVSLILFTFNLFSEERLIIHQTALEGKELISFISIYDSSNQLKIDDLEIENFTVNYGLKKGVVKSLNPFSSAQYGTSYIFMVDISKSVTKENFQEIKDSIKLWIKTLNPGDAAAILTFGEKVKVLSELSYDREKLISIVDKKVQRTDMKTKLYGGIVQAHSVASFIDKRFPARKAIICLTDGINETEDPTSKSDLKSLFEQTSIPFYSINFAEDSNSAVEKGSKEMREISEISRGAFFDANDISIQNAYKAARNYIDETLMLTSICDSCTYNDSTINLKISYKNFEQEVSSIAKLKMKPFEEEKVFEVGERNETWGVNYLLISLAITAITILLIFNFIRRNNIITETLNLFQNDIDSVDFEEVATKPLSILISSLSTDLDDHFKIKVIDQFTIGRSSSCDLTIPDQPEISGKHCLLELKDNVLHISDLNSRNGTSVNGVPIRNKFSLKSRDVVGMGRSEYRLIYEEENE